MNTHWIEEAEQLALSCLRGRSSFGISRTWPTKESVPRSNLKRGGS